MRIYGSTNTAGAEVLRSSDSVEIYPGHKLQNWMLEAIEANVTDNTSNSREFVDKMIGHILLPDSVPVSVETADHEALRGLAEEAGTYIDPVN